MADNSNTGVPEDEKETNDLLALLYAEDGFDDLDSELVSDDELGGMQSLRSLFKDLPDEEPSDAVSNKLMALAAQHAPKPVTESRGFFAWFSDTFMPVMTHPGMAAAATLVLVVGVAGTLYIKGEAKMAQPQVASRAEAPSDSSSLSAPALSAPAPSAPTSAGPGSTLREGTAATKELDLKQDSFDGAAAEGTETSSIATERSKSKGDSLADAEKREAPSEDPASEEPASIGGLLKGGNAEFKSSSAKGGKSRGASTRDSSLDDSLGQATGSANGFGGGGDSSVRRVKDIVDAPRASEPSPEPAPVVTTDSVPARRAAPKPKLVKKKPSSRPSSPPPPPSAAADTGEDDSDDQDEEEAEAKPSKADKKKSPPESVRLHNLAIAAAKREDCTRVVSLGNQIRKLDSAYYDRTFLSDSRLTECRKRANSKTSK